MREFVAFDVETTGTLADRDEIIEIAAVLFQDRAPRESFVQLVRPCRPVPADATQVNGISNEMLADQPPIEDVLEPFARFCGGRTLVAHNAPFDYKFIAAVVKKHGLPAPAGAVLDTLAMVKKLKTDLISYRLGSVCKAMGVKCGDFHRAKEDATYCGKLFIKLVEKAFGRAEPELERLAAMSGGALRFPQIRPQAKQLSLLAGF